MKKFSKMVAGAAAAVMALAALPLSAVSAAEAVYTLGDVDKDGVITGHDSAMVSRYLYDEEYSLTEAQLALADMNGDSVVDQSDLETIHAQEAYVIGDVMKSGKDHGNLSDAYYTLMFWAYNCVGVSVEVVRSDIDASGADADYADCVYQDTIDFLDVMQSDQKKLDAVADDFVLSIDEVSLNLMDVNADGKVTYADAYRILVASSRAALANGFEEFDEIATYYGVKGRYDVMPKTTDENGYTILVEKEITE